MGCVRVSWGFAVMLFLCSVFEHYRKFDTSAESMGYQSHAHYSCSFPVDEYLAQSTSRSKIWVCYTGPMLMPKELSIVYWISIKNAVKTPIMDTRARHLIHSFTRHPSIHASLLGSNSAVSPLLTKLSANKQATTRYRGPSAQPNAAHHQQHTAPHASIHSSTPSPSTAAKSSTPRAVEYSMNHIPA